MKSGFLKISIFAILLTSSYVYYSITNYQPGLRKNDHGNTINILPYELSENRNSNVILIFLHGYPNTFRLWDQMVENLKKDYTCLNISYPNYTNDLRLSWGMDLRDLSFYIKKTILEVEKKINTERNQETSFKKIVISHDWGAFLSYLVDSNNKGFIDELITLDVSTSVDDTISAKLYTLSYQIYLATNFLLGDKIGNYMTKLFLNRLKKPIFGISEDDYDKINTSYNFFYFHFWKIFPYYFNFSRNYSTHTPICFIYGKDKGFMFHNQRFLNMLEKNPYSKVMDLQGDHWFMERPENMNIVINVIREKALKYNK